MPKPMDSHTTSQLQGISVSPCEYAKDSKPTCLMRHLRENKNNCDGGLGCGALTVEALFVKLIETSPDRRLACLPKGWVLRR